MKDYFVYNGVRYYVGTVIELKEECRKDFKCSSYLKFIKYDDDSNKCCFGYMDDIWHGHWVSKDRLPMYIQSIHKAELIPENTNKTMEPKYIDGIVEAWTWYIIVMIFALLIKGASSTIILWIIASTIFFTWRYNKINGK